MSQHYQSSVTNDTSISKLSTFFCMTMIERLVQCLCYCRLRRSSGASEHSNTVINLFISFRRIYHIQLEERARSSGHPYVRCLHDTPQPSLWVLEFLHEWTWNAKWGWTWLPDNGYYQSHLSTLRWTVCQILEELGIQYAMVPNITWNASRVIQCHSRALSHVKSYKANIFGVLSIRPMQSLTAGDYK
jgi:hypothetical protein